MTCTASTSVAAVERGSCRAENLLMRVAKMASRPEELASCSSLQGRGGGSRQQEACVFLYAHV